MTFVITMTSNIQTKNQNIHSYQDQNIETGD